jgi:molybdopterin converting factor subunit 1
VNVRALFFATYRDLPGASELEVELTPGATVNDLVATIRAMGAPFQALPSRLSVAVNHRYAHPDHVLTDGDEVALIPPVAGG